MCTAYLQTKAVMLLRQIKLLQSHIFSFLHPFSRSFTKDSAPQSRCSFTHRLQSTFISKVRTDPVTNPNVLHRIEKQRLSSVQLAITLYTSLNEPRPSAVRSNHTPQTNWTSGLRHAPDLRVRVLTLSSVTRRFSVRF